ncbi:DUF502 domain-containing protein [Pelagibacteraceae bacterium]|nr:DUF502 domain-containing protein [Pelagibacteraceae bacterium]
MSNKDKPSFLKKIQTYFLTGALVAAPIGATIYLTIFIVEFIAGLLPSQFNPNQFLPYEIPGLELVIAIIFFIVLGLVTSTLFGRTIVSYFDTLIKRVPLAGNIYTAIKQITETFSKTDSSSQKVVMFEYPRKGIQAIGFMTGNAKGEIRDKAGIEMVNVFVPTTPNPTSGFLLFVPKEDVVILDMKYEDAIKLIVSAGMVIPENQ